MAQKIRSYQQKLRIAFLGFFCVFYVMILWFDWGTTSFSFLVVNIIKYAFIIGCVVYSYMASRDVWLSVALSLTAVADLFLLFGTSIITYSIGVAVFCLAQLSHAFQLNPQTKMRSLFYFWIAACIGLMSFAVAIFTLSERAGLIGISICYALLLIYNLVSSFLQVLHKKEKPFYALVFAFIGFLLFLCCDASVMLYNILSTSASASGLFVPIIGNCMWTFYAPSQYFLANSYLIPRK